MFCIGSQEHGLILDRRHVKDSVALKTWRLFMGWF